MSQLIEAEASVITDSKEIGRIVGIIENALKKSKLETLQRRFQAKRYLIGLPEFYGWVGMDLALYLQKEGEEVTPETLGYIGSFGRCDSVELPEVDGRAIPECVYRVTGYRALAEMDPFEITADGIAIERHLAVWVLTCMAYDHIRQPLYHELIRRNAEVAHEDNGCQ